MLVECQYILLVKKYSNSKIRCIFKRKLEKINLSIKINIYIY